jgi:hypothetical protein
VEPGALVVRRNLGEAMGGFEGELFEDLHHHRTRSVPGSASRGRCEDPRPQTGSPSSARVPRVPSQKPALHESRPEADGLCRSRRGPGAWRAAAWTLRRTQGTGTVPPGGDCRRRRSPGPVLGRNTASGEVALGRPFLGRCGVYTNKPVSPALSPGQQDKERSWQR